MNPLLAKLQPYPFEKLRALIAGNTISILNGSGIVGNTVPTTGIAVTNTAREARDLACGIRSV